MDLPNYVIQDKQARFLIMRNFYEEVMSKLLKRFLMVLHFRATGDVLEENCDILLKILPHLPRKHVLKKEDKYRENLFIQSKRDLTPKPNLDVSKFDFTMSFACLTEIEGLPSWKNHNFCIFCESNCKNILLGNAEKKDCNDCGFCRTLSNCLSHILTKNLNTGRKTRNIGAHTSQFSAISPNIQENIRALTALYEYLHTNGNWRNFEKTWINHEAFFEIREDIRLIEKCSITFLLEKFKERVRILEDVFAIKEKMDKILSKMNKSTLRISIQLSISKLAVVEIADLGSFLKNAKLKGLNSRMRMTIEKVVNKSLAQLSDEFKFDVRICGLKKVACEEEFEQFEAEIKFTSPDSNAFEFYQCDTHPKSKILQAELEKAMFAELESKFSNITDINLTELTLGFTFWDTGSLHIMFSLVKNDRSSFNKREIQILNTSFKDMISSKHEFFKEIFGENVQVSADTSPSCTKIETLNGQLEVKILTEDGYYHSNVFVRMLKRSVETLLTQELQLEKCSKINKNLATMLLSVEQFVNSHSQTLSNVVDIARIGSVHAFIAETLSWFVLTIDVDQGNPKIDCVDEEIDKYKKPRERSRGMANMKESKVPTKTDWRILCGALLSEVKNYLRSLLHHPASGNFPKDGGKLYKTILELYLNGELDDLPIYWRTLILPENGISDSEIFNLHTLRYLLLKSNILKPDAVGAINNLCVMMNGIKYFLNVVPYYVMLNVVDQIKFGLSTLGCAKESMKVVEHLCTLFEDITLSEHELSTYKYEMHYFDCECQAELIFKVKECLRCLFHDPAYGDFPRDGKKLHQVMEEWQQQGKLKDLEKNLFSLLLPDSKITDSETFDIHLLGYFLCTNIKDEKRKIFDEIFHLTNQFIRYDKIWLKLDILSKIWWKVSPSAWRFDVFYGNKENDLHKFVKFLPGIIDARHRLPKEYTFQSIIDYKKASTDEEKIF